MTNEEFGYTWIQLICCLQLEGKSNELRKLAYLDDIIISRDGHDDIQNLQQNLFRHFQTI